MTALEVNTRFRAYQLGQPGSLFSYFATGKFTLIEARVTNLSRASIRNELQQCGKQTIDTLHITSWDDDHCAAKELDEILNVWKPKKIEFPGYISDTDNFKESKSIIEDYKRRASYVGENVNCVQINPEYIKGLETAKELGYRDILYWPKEISQESSNNNSTVKVFREGSFNLASLGDVEDINIAAYLRGCGMFKRETDVLTLAHHGADCPTNSEKFFEIVKPRIAVCSSNYDNEYDHPRQVVRDRLSKLNIPVYTTKRGDVVIVSLPPHTGGFRAYNLSANSTEIFDQKDFEAKKFGLLSMNLDTIRNIYRPKPSYRNIK